MFHLGTMVALLVASAPVASAPDSSLAARADSVRVMLEHARAEADSMQALVRTLEGQLAQLQNEQLMAAVAADSSLAIAVIIGEARVRWEPETSARELGILHKGTSVQAVGAAGEFLEIEWDQSYGYIHTVNVQMTESIKGMLKLNRSHVEEVRAGRARQQRLAAEAASAQRAAEQAERVRQEQVAQATRTADLTRRYGDAVAGRLLRGEIWIGMSAAMAIDSIGKPESVNRTVNASNVSEQWVYGGRDAYLYFENGVLSSWQQSTKP